MNTRTITGIVVATSQHQYACIGSERILNRRHNATVSAGCREQRANRRLKGLADHYANDRFSLKLNVSTSIGHAGFGRHSHKAPERLNKLMAALIYGERNKRGVYPNSHYSFTGRNHLTYITKAIKSWIQNLYIFAKTN